MGDSLDSLLLLPAPPAPVTPAALRAAYLPPLQDALLRLRELHLAAPTILQVVVTLPRTSRRFRQPRADVFAEYEQLVAGVYGLVAAVAAQHDVDDAIDARVLLCASEDASPEPIEAAAFTPVPGPLVDLPTLAYCRRRWRLVFAVDGEAGQRLLARYTALVARRRPPLEGQLQTLAGGVSMMGDPSTTVTPPPAHAHQTVAVGGTFDYLHVGHKLLLTATALLLQPSAQRPLRLIVGVTGDALLQNKKYAEVMQSWPQRQQGIVSFLRTILHFPPSSTDDVHEVTVDQPGAARAIHTQFACGIVVECVEIQDPFGPTITDPTISALVVSGETRAGGQAVNTKRLEKGFSSLEVFEVSVLSADDVESDSASFDAKISSSAIRQRKAELARTGAKELGKF